MAYQRGIASCLTNSDRVPDELFGTQPLLVVLAAARAVLFQSDS